MATASDVLRGLALGYDCCKLFPASVACVGGSWVASDTLIEAGDWAGIRANAEFVATLGAAG